MSRHACCNKEQSGRRQVTWCLQSPPSEPPSEPHLGHVPCPRASTHHFAGPPEVAHLAQFIHQIPSPRARKNHDPNRHPPPRILESVPRPLQATSTRSSDEGIIPTPRRRLRAVKPKATAPWPRRLAGRGEAQAAAETRLASWLSLSAREQTRHKACRNSWQIS